MRKRKFSSIEKEFVSNRAKRKCEYCRHPFDFSHDAFHIEHIIPYTGGGSNEMDNLAFSCDGCNTYKGAKTSAIEPDTKTIVTLFHPRQQNWEDHFSWEFNFSIVKGITDIGRATIEQLQMNRSGLINIRKALWLYGVHP